MESPPGIIETPSSKMYSRTPNLNEEKDELTPKSFKVPLNSKFDEKDISRSLEVGDNLQKGENGNIDESNSNSISLIRIKSEHNLKENKEKEAKQASENASSNQQKEKSYNSKNFFTENFDDQEMEDAINKIKRDPNFEDSSDKMLAKVDNQNSNQNENQNIELFDEEQTLSYDDSALKDFSDDPQKIASIIESANNDYQKLVNSNTIKSNSNAILVNDNIFNDNSHDELNEDSSISDHLDLGKTVNLKKEGLYEQLRKDKDYLKESDNLFEEIQKNKQTSDLKPANNQHSKSTEDIDDGEELKQNVCPISNIDIERIGSPNKPKQDQNSEGVLGIGIKKELKDTRQKIDDDDDEEIITGSQTVNNSNSQDKSTDLDNTPDKNCMSDYLEKSQLSMDEKDTGDFKVLVDDIMKGLIKELDEKLFPQRPLCLLAADLTNISLEQATMLLNDLTPERERIIVERIIQSQNRTKGRSRGNRMVPDNGRIVLFEKKGIQTDLVAIEDYIQTSYKYL